MKRMVTAAVVSGLAVALTICPARSAPKPSRVPTTWQVDIDLKEPKAIELPLPGRARPQRFWYVRYTVTNRTGQELIFVPAFVLYTDTGQILRAGSKVPTAAFQAIKNLYNAPLLKDITGMTGRLLQGEDNAKEGVAIWRDFDPKAGAFDIFIGGLSGENAEVRLPKPIEVVELDATGKETTVVKDKAIVSKTLHLRYSIPGEAAARLWTKPKLEKRQWVMR